MKQDTMDFLETLLFIADDPDAGEGRIAFEGKTVYDFSPSFTEAAEKFVSAFRTHLESTGFNMSKLDASKRSFGGNVYFSLSGHGVGFFDDDDKEITGLHERLKEWAGAYRFEGLDGLLEVNADGKIDLAIVPQAIDQFRENVFAVPKNNKPIEPKRFPHTPGKWTIEGEGMLAAPVTGAIIGTTRIGTGGYGEIELVDGTNEPEGNKYLIAAAPDMLEALEELAEFATDATKDNCSIPDAETLDMIIDKARAAISKAKGVTP